MQDVPPDPSIRALVFDVFGTVVDWRGGVAREVDAVAARHGVSLDAEAFADAWRAGYAPAMQRVRVGDLPWMRIDALHRLILDTLLPRFGLDALDEPARDALNRAWHRLDPWPDGIEGLTRLKRRFTIAPLSNGNFSLLTNMAKRAALPWDCILSAELFRHYKPDRETYLGAADLLGIAPRELMLVACHPSDLRAATAAGLRTAYVARPLENGPDGRTPLATPASSISSRRTSSRSMRFCRVIEETTDARTAAHQYTRSFVVGRLPGLTGSDRMSRRPIGPAARGCEP